MCYMYGMSACFAPTLFANTNHPLKWRAFEALFIRTPVANSRIVTLRSSMTIRLPFSIGLSFRLAGGFLERITLAPEVRL